MDIRHKRAMDTGDVEMAVLARVPEENRPAMAALLDLPPDYVIAVAKNFDTGEVAELNVGGFIDRLAAGVIHGPDLLAMLQDVGLARPTAGEAGV